jgi:hypothetical protein
MGAVMNRLVLKFAIHVNVVKILNVRVELWSHVYVFHVFFGIVVMDQDVYKIQLQTNFNFEIILIFSVCFDIYR